MTRLALAVGTVGGAGFFPIAPGTVGSAIGVAVYLLTAHWPAAWQIGLLAAISVVGTWGATGTARALGREDPGPVIVDEVAGQLLTLLLTGVGVVGAIAGFFIFRILDIVKPWPARNFEALHGGVGIMADDLMAGVYGNILMWVGLQFVYGIAG
jgi:phosphatidylglycerophosphatase A